VALSFAPASRRPATLRLAFTGILNDKLRASTAPPSRTRTASSTSSPPPRWSPPTPAGLPVLRRAGLQGHLRVTLVIDDHLAAYSNSPSWTRPRSRAVASGSTSADHGHVDLPGGLRRRPLGHTDPVDVDGCRCGGPPAGKGHLTSSPRGGRPRAAVLHGVLRIPYPGDKVDMWPSPTSPRGHGELGCITYRESALLVDRRPRPASSSNGSPTWCATRWRTCGSATSSP